MFQTGLHTMALDLDPGEPVLITVEVIKEGKGEESGGDGGPAIDVYFGEKEEGATIKSAL